MQPLPEIAGPLDRERFERDVRNAAQPVVLRRQCAQWPLVQATRDGDAAVADGLAALAGPAEVDAVLLPPAHRGRLFYDDSGQGFNFVRNRVPLAQVLEQVRRYATFDRAPAVAAQSAPADDAAPGFASTHPQPLLDAAVRPRLWLGTALVTPAHFDESANLACVIAGRRRFTLFPPQAIGDLAVGPIGHAPTGTPISLAELDPPDLARYPRLAGALAVARQAELGPGDAIFIPPLWWHHVASLAKLNLMANYWWKPVPDAPSALPALLHALAALGDLPPAQREAWRALFDHWVFSSDPDRLQHLTGALRGVHGPMTPALREQILRFVRAQLPA